jgi:pimeloyl-ACP methyl ester carboxylesterase
MMNHEHGYAKVNGLEMYYEIHGEGDPIVLLHGSFSAIGTSFGQVLPRLEKDRKVIAVEFQGHGRTADIDRPLSVENLADDVAGLLGHLGLEKADAFGYSLGAGVALQLALRHPGLVRKLVLASVTYDNSGFHPGMTEGIDHLQPEHLMGSPFHDEYVALSPRPDFAGLVAKVKAMNHALPELSPEAVRSITAPVLLMIGDSDIIRPEHSVEFFRLLGGGVAGDQAGLPQSQLAVLPGTTHVTLVHRADWLSSMINEFLATS